MINNEITAYKCAISAVCGIHREIAKEIFVQMKKNLKHYMQSTTSIKLPITKCYEHWNNFMTGTQKQAVWMV